MSGASPVTPGPVPRPSLGASVLEPGTGRGGDDGPGPVRVLLVEDDAAFADLVRAMLGVAAPEFEVEHAGRLSSALARLVRDRYDVVVTDLNLPDSTGSETVRHLQRAAHQVPLVVLSGIGDIDVALDAIHEGADDFVVKGALDADTVARLVRVALERRRRQATGPTAEAAPFRPPGLAALRTVGGHLLQVVDRLGLHLGLVVLRVEADRRGSRGQRPGLLEVSEVLRSTLRRADLVCRVGPDELAVVLVSHRPELGAAVARLEAAVVASGAGPDVRVGFAAYDCEHPVSVDQLIVQARHGARPVSGGTRTE